MKFKVSVLMLVVLALSMCSVVFAAEKEYISVKMNVTYNGTKIANGDSFTGVKAGDKLEVTASCSDERATNWSTNSNFMQEKGYTFNREGMAFIGYMFDSQDPSKYIDDYSNPTSLTITIPNFAAGSEHYVVINAVGACDGLVENDKELQATSGTFAIKFTMKTEDSKVEDINLEIVKEDNNVVVTPKVENGTFSKFTYNWDKDAEKESTDNPLKVAIPTAVGEHTLRVKGYTNNNVTSEKTYTIEVKAKTPTSDDLVVEDWMRVNKDIDSLAVSLRNDSDEYEKENKNIYALNEEVVYYVDYKNGGKEISQEVSLVLELPLEFEAVDSFGGTVDKEKKTITWIFEKGLEKEQEGTKIVKIKYTSLGKASKRSETIYPSAKIYQGASKTAKDISTVINYIFKDEDTEMVEDHFPYMYGDANATTFRPDDTITRAEGALVLARIFGINYSGTTVVGNEYSDLGDTYIEAQKAIVASTKLGLINGYNDGSYKPNNKMTKAEFMKIIAAYVERRADDDNIKGLEVKDIEDSIKLYKNRTSTYVVGNKTTSEHWAINYVTLLTRINMTAISEKQKSVGLDDEITRAEVAQLINFFLLRAPAESGKTTFSDVAKNHKLFADILEATRPVHSFTLTHEGTEVVVD